MKVDSLYEYACKFGVSLSDSHLEKYSLFLDLLAEWNSKMNLVGISDKNRIIHDLLLDSLIPAPFLPSTGRMADIGSGAGFPGLIIKVLKPDLDVKLIESNGKKVNFLKHAVRSLGLKNITVVNRRIESIIDLLESEGFDVLTSRAMTDLAGIIRLCSTALLPGGTLVGFLGRHGREELKGSGNSIEENNLSIRDSITYRLPGKKSDRMIVFLEKKFPGSTIYRRPPRVL